MILQQLWQSCLPRIFGDRPATYLHRMNFTLFLAITYENSTTLLHLGVCVHLAKIWQITPSVTPSPTSLIAHFMWHFLKESRELAEKIFHPPRIFLMGRHSILSNELLATSDNLFAQKYSKSLHQNRRWKLGQQSAICWNYLGWNFQHLFERECQLTKF